MSLSVGIIKQSVSGLGRSGSKLFFKVGKLYMVVKGVLQS